MNRRTSVRVHEAQKGESHMKQAATLTTASLLTILFMTFHLTGDILFRMAPAGLVNLLAVFIFVVQLYGTLVLGGRRAGCIIIFLGSALALVVPVVHMKGTRGVIGGESAPQAKLSFSCGQSKRLASPRRSPSSYRRAHC